MNDKAQAMIDELVAAWRNDSNDGTCINRFGDRVSLRITNTCFYLERDKDGTE